MEHFTPRRRRAQWFWWRTGVMVCWNRPDYLFQKCVHLVWGPMKLIWSAAPGEAHTVRELARAVWEGRRRELVRFHWPLMLYYRNGAYERTWAQECAMCDGEGMVTWEHRGETISNRCPKCNGAGKGAPFDKSIR